MGKYKNIKIARMRGGYEEKPQKTYCNNYFSGLEDRMKRIDELQAEYARRQKEGVKN